MVQDKKPQIGWSSYEDSLRRFNHFYFKAQNMFSMVRSNHGLLPELFDTIHEIYRAELPYYDKKKREDKPSQFDDFKSKHDNIELAMNNYFRNGQTYRNNNFGSIYKKLDTFFSDLTIAGAHLNFLPPVITPRDLEDKYNSVRQL